jgi:Icc protein
MFHLKHFRQGSNVMAHKSIETKYYEERASFFEDLTRMGALSRRGFLHVAGVSAGITAAKGLIVPQSFQLIEIAQAAEPATPGFTIAYISDTHLYTRNVNDRFIRSAVKAVEEVNALDPQPDFVLFGGDLAQLGRPEELDLGAQILKDLKAPLKMMVGEHDWFLDMGERWRSLFGPSQYSFDHKGVHFVTLMSVNEKDFWTARGMSPEERMHTVAGLDNGVQSRFEVGPEGRQWLQSDLAAVDKKTPVVIFSHSPLYKYYRNWNFWTEDADEVQAILAKFDTVSVIHGHTHQLLLNRLGNISFYGLLSTAWPWPYAPEGLPKLTVQMNRADPFNVFDGCGDGQLNVLASGMIDKVYNLWNRNPITVRANYLSSNGAQDRPPATTLSSY